jgi:hypothetical protein
MTLEIHGAYSSVISQRRLPISQIFDGFVEPKILGSRSPALIAHVLKSEKVRKPKNVVIMMDLILCDGHT